VPLTLVTGPANSAKAQVVLDGYVAALGREPLLVVPRAQDAEHYRRELAERGVVFGVRVERFAGLLREIALRAGVRERVLGRHARERIVEAAIGSARLERLAASAATPGFAAACGQLIAELEARRVEPGRLRGALRRWGGAAWGEEVAQIYSAYRERLERVGALDEELAAWRALDAVRVAPGLWGGTPVFLYGFDDLDPLQRDAVETLSAEAPVTVSLPYEAGRVAFAGRAGTFEELRPLAREHVVLEAAGDYYEDGALYELERALFEEGGRAGAGGDGAAVTLIEASSQQGEYKEVARRVAGLLSEGFAAEDVAVVARATPADAAQLEQALVAEGVPFAPFLRTRFGDTAAGRGLLCLLRFALLDGGAQDVVGYLRTPGLLDHGELVDDLEARVRREGRTDAEELWAQLHFPLDAAARLRAAERGPAALIDAVAAELERLFAAPWRRRAAVLPREWHAQALAVDAARRALAELRSVALADPWLTPSAAELCVLLERVEAAPPPGAGVQVCDPLALRARRVRALVLCGLQAGTFPRAEPAHPFFGEEERRALARSSGLLVGAAAGDPLSAERYLFYATVSRPTARLVLSWRTAGDEGEVAQRSLFVEDILDVLDGGEVVGDAGLDTGCAVVHRAARLAPLSPATLGERPLSPSSLELWSDCPVKWLVERELRARPLEPDPEPLVRGSLAHEALERVLRSLRSLCGSARLDDAARRSRAQSLLDEAMASLGASRPLSPDGVRARAGMRRLHADLSRYLEYAAEWGSRFEPQEFELAFGLSDDGPAAVSLADGELLLRGRIDRVDVFEGRAIVHDYKASAAFGAGKWVADRRFQVALYMLAAAQLLGVEPVGGFYQALSGKLATRGLLLADADPGARCSREDVRDREAFAAVLDEAVGLAVAAARELRAGLIEPRPHTCGRGRCAFPAICRARP
jgi:ATP-dependent helicase/DNAse subunit B